MKTLAEFFATRLRVADLLGEENSKYLAHLPTKPFEGKIENETLHVHSELVSDYADKLCEAHLLNPVIDRLVETLAVNSPFASKSELLNGWVKRLFVDGIVFHDFGKINPSFQARRMKNELFRYEKNSPFYPPHGHSWLGAWLYTAYWSDIIFESEELENEEEQLFLLQFLVGFTYSILRHHRPDLQKPFEGVVGSGFKEKRELMVRFAATYGWKFSDQAFDFLENWDTYADHFLKWRMNSEFAQFALFKLHFSLLTASDYMASSEYMNQEKEKRKEQEERGELFGVLKQDGQRAELIKNIRTFEYNSATHASLDNPPVFPTGKGKAELNKLRQIMAIEVVKKVRAHTDKHLFYLEAPTGGGKTNLSMLALAEFLDANPEINKVYYVFPFTTLVTQTHKALLQTTKLTNTQVAELHSRAGLLTKTGENEEEDGEYGNEKPDWLDHLFLHFPITVLTHVRFFHILCTHRKEANYLLHRLANSVVIVDEVQAYPPKHWDKLIYFIRNFAKHFNIRFLLMSATLPKLGNLKVIRERTDDIVYLLDKPKERFFLNDNFAGRVKFRFDLMNEALTLDRLTELVLEKSKDWAERNTNHPNSVFAIIEFIFKKTSKEFFDKIDKLHKGFFDEIFVLSGTILEPRRRQIINFLKHPNNRSKRVLLITTQVVEAGVDIDMDFGFKDSSIPDSDEQLAGRINRNVSKSTGDLYLFNLDSASMVYKNDPRLKAMKENKELKENHERMLNEKDFDLLYNKVLLGIDGINELDQIENLSTYRRRIRQADFREVEKHFRLIDQENYSVFVPIALPVCVAGEKEKEPWEDVFKKEEKEFLSKFDVSPRYSEERKEECYFGDEIWQVFEKLVKKDEDKSISAREIDLKQIQGIMSKFIFSILANDNSEKYLKQYIDPEKSKYGFFYLSNLAVYDYSSGLKSEKDAHFDLVFP